MKQWKTYSLWLRFMKSLTCISSIYLLISDMLKKMFEIIGYKRLPYCITVWGVLLLLLSHFSRVRLCATPEMAATRLPRPWDSPGKNAGVGCHFLLQCIKVKNESEVAQLCRTPRDPMNCSLPGSSVHGIFQARVLEWGGITFSVRSASIFNYTSTAPLLWHKIYFNGAKIISYKFLKFLQQPILCCISSGIRHASCVFGFNLILSPKQI